MMEPSASEDPSTREGPVQPSLEVRPAAQPANLAAIHAGPYDVVIDLAYRVPTEESAALVSRVAMSYEHAQAFATLLQRQIDRYVEQAGDLPTVAAEPVNEGSET